MALRLSLPPHPRTQHKSKQKVRMPVIMKLRVNGEKDDEDMENVISYADMMELEQCMFAYTKEIKINMCQHLSGHWTISDMKQHHRTLSRKVKDNKERVFDPDTAIFDVAINTMMEYFSRGRVTSYRQNSKDDDTKESDEEDFELERSIYRVVQLFCNAWSDMKCAKARLSLELCLVGGKSKKEKTRATSPY
jgi:hypothetical protein